MSVSDRFRELEVSGTYRDMGRQIGEGARDEIRQFCDMALERVNQTVRVSYESAMRVVAEAIPLAEAYSAEMVDELRGMAEGARVSFEKIMLLQVRNQLKPDGDAGCTSFSLAPSKLGRHGGLVGQNWDNDPALAPVTIVLTRRPANKPAFISVTQAGLIAYIGLSEAGFGVCLNTLPAPSGTAGVPHYFMVRGIYESRTLDEAVQAVRRATRVIPANIMLATPEGPADLEVTLDDVHVLRPEDKLGITHTNHCLHPALQAINGQFPELIQSHARSRRLGELLDLNAAADPISLATLMEALRDHEGYPRSICRHANDDEVTGFWETVFSVIIDVDQRLMRVSCGTPCCRPYESYVLN